MTLDDLESSDYSGGVYFDELSVDAIRTIYFVGSLIGSLLCLFVVALHLYYRHKHARPAYHSSLVCYRAISNIFGFFSHIASFIYESPNEEEDGGSHCEYIGMFYHATLLMSNSWFFCMALDLLYQVNDPFKHLDNLRKRYHFFTWTTPLLLCPFLLNNDEYGPSQFGFCFIRRTENEMDRNHTLFQFFYIPLALAWSFSVYSLAFTLYVYRIGGFLSGSRTLYIQNMRYGLFGVVSNGILWTWLGFVWLAQFYEAGTVTVLPYMFSIGLGSQGVIDLVTYVYSTKHLRDAASSDIQHDPEFFHNMLREDIIRCIGWGIREATLQEAEGFDSPLIEKRLAGGASGSIFCLTWDNKFIVKTVTKEESKVLQSLLAPLVDYFRQYPRSLLTRFVGLHSLQMHPGSRPVHFVVMPNIFPRMDQELHEVYDIKMSAPKPTMKEMDIDEERTWSDSECDSNKQSSTNGLFNCLPQSLPVPCALRNGRTSTLVVTPRADEDGSAPVSTRKVKVLKDLDLVFSLELPKNEQEEIVQQLQLDSAFLCAHYIMDYSLLLGVRYPEQWSPAALNARIFGGVLVGQPLAFGPAVAKMHKECSSDEDVSGGVETDEDINGPLVQYGIGIIDILQVCHIGIIDILQVCHIGIIDVLQKYDMSKRLERFTKVLLLGKDPDGISAVHEREYQRRFSRRMEMVFGTRRMDKKSRRLREKLNQIPRPSAPIWHPGETAVPLAQPGETAVPLAQPGETAVPLAQPGKTAVPLAQPGETAEAEDDSTAPARPSGRMSGITPTSVPPAQIPGFQVNQLYRRQEFGPLEFDCKKDTPQPAEGSNNDHAGAVSEAGQDLNLNGSALDIDSLSERLSTNGLPELGKRPSSKSKEVVVNPLFGQDEDSDDYEPAGEDEGVFSAAESVS
eukprot:gene8026-9537_t